MECGCPSGDLFDAAPHEVGIASVPHVGDDGELAAMRELATMRKELAAFREEVAALRGDKAAALRVRAAGKRECAEGGIVASYVEVGASCWSIPLVANFESSAAEAGLLLLLYALNVALQALFCYIVVRELGSSASYDDASVEELVTWRRTIAHDARFYDGARSLAHRVCSGDAGLEVSATQQAQYAELAAYMGGVDDNDWPAGPWMACACLVAFTLTMIKELRTAVELLDAVCALPRGDTTALGRHREDEDDPDDDTFDMLAISHARRAFAATTLAVRFAVPNANLFGFASAIASWSRFMLFLVTIFFLLLVVQKRIQPLAGRGNKSSCGLRPPGPGPSARCRLPTR